MKICVSSTRNDNEAEVDLRFGRCAYFAIYDSETKEYEFIDNQSNQALQGAGVTAAQVMMDQDVKTVITGNVGPNAMSIFKTADIQIYRGTIGKVKDIIKKYENGILTPIEEAAPAHHGMGVGRRNGRR